MWILNDAVDDKTIYVKSTKQGLTYIPVRGWEVGLDDWVYDNTLTVTGNIISKTEICLIQGFCRVGLNKFLIFTKPNTSTDDL